MAPVILTTIKWLFLSLLYLFIARAVRVVYLDLVGPKVPRQRTPGGGRRRGQPKSVVVYEQDQTPRTYPLGEDLVIGRTEDCGVTLADTYISQEHARLYAKDGTWFVEDLGSTNGTYLNRVKVTGPSPLAVGDEVRVGKTRLEIRR